MNKSQSPSRAKKGKAAKQPSFVDSESESEEEAETARLKAEEVDQHQEA